MESGKNGNLGKLVAFFLIVALLAGAVALSASGWQGDELMKPDSGDTAGGDNPPSGEADENTDGNDEQTTVPPVEEPEKLVYYSYLTGLEISEDESLIKPLCIVFDTEAPMYGISTSLLSVEIPIEGGSTRLLAFTNSATELGKLGSIAPTRGYIDLFASHFGGIPLYCGSDGNISALSDREALSYVDLSEYSGYHYTEYDRYSYTNDDLLGAYIKNNGVSTVKTDTPTLPFIHTASSELTDGRSASTALIRYDVGKTTELIYSAETDCYRIKKNSEAVIDRLNGTALEYKNAFILLADATTYETEASTELVLDTGKGGKGYYLNGGRAIEITWQTGTDGNLEFRNADGELINVDCGTTYISITRSSQRDEIKFF
ncbi:MAG: DUF3048 C-terminal domain-containing protein [Clostridia bacterium]|nr:DUF3048 C-terminal domain-containing protein [Clostridia bacterium]